MYLSLTEEVRTKIIAKVQKRGPIQDSTLQIQTSVGFVLLHDRNNNLKAFLCALDRDAKETLNGKALAGVNLAATKFLP